MEKLSMNVLLVVIALLVFPGCDKEEKTGLLPPVADFELSEDQIYIWETVKFQDISENEPEEWEWYFEGGEPEVSDESGPEVLYPEPGLYTVKLTVRNEKGENVKESEYCIEVSEYHNYFGTLTDERDGQEYKTTDIAGISIMAENLRYMTGDAVFYDNDPENGELYGMLYRWETAMEACPAGWRLPTRNEYDMIREYLGEDVAGGKLKMSGTEYWLSPNKYGTNETGFSAVGAGGYMPGHMEFYGINESATFWTQTEDAQDEDHAWSAVLTAQEGRMGIQNATGKDAYYLSVRCIED